MRRYSIFTFIAIALFACKPKSEPAFTDHEIALSPTEKILFLDSLQATEFITKDPMGAFFEEITMLDMQIQLQGSASPNREETLASYKELLKTDVAAFTPKEKALLTQVWEQAYQDVNSIQKGLFPDTILLV